MSYISSINVIFFVFTLSLSLSLSLCILSDAIIYHNVHLFIHFDANLYTYNKYCDI